MGVGIPERGPIANYIDGDWAPSATGETYGRRNPYRPADVLEGFPSSGEVDVELAVSAAFAAAPSWSRAPLAERGAILTRAAALIEERAPEIAVDMTREMGKPLRESRAEVARAAEVFRFFGAQRWQPVGEVFEQAANGAPVRTLRRPLGVVALITPWNFPIAIPAWKAAPALVYGNAVVLKVAQDAPLTGVHLVRCLDDAGLPPGVLNLLIGRGAAVGDPLVRHPLVGGISFTGSVGVGRSVQAAATPLGKRVQLELGGHSPLIVMADADLPRAVEAAFSGAFWSAGQKCTATRRVFVQAEVADELAERLVERVAAARVGDPARPDTEVGPVVSEAQMTDVLGAIERGRADGGVVLAGGGRADGDAYLVEPTVFTDVADDATLAREEVFGPVVSLYRFDTLEEAISRANAVEYGLSAAIFTSDLSSERQFVDGIEAGILHVNSPTSGADVHVPFGGVKASGYGPHEQGRAALEFYSEQVTVYHDV